MKDVASLGGGFCETQVYREIGFCSFHPYRFMGQQLKHEIAAVSVGYGEGGDCQAQLLWAIRY